MTHAELIATKLFGWRQIESEYFDERWYENAQGDQRLFGREKLYSEPEDDWPDFADPQLKYYWIAQMEAKLAERGLFFAYANALAAIVPAQECKPKGIYQIPSRALGFFITLALGLYATPEQRIEAAVKVLEGEE